MFRFASSIILSCLGIAGAIVSAPAQVPELPETLYNYASQDLPRYFMNAPDNVPVNNPVTDAGATLGRVLFYDKKLSANRSIACASCHTQDQGFSDSRQFSEGFEGGLTRRNSMGLANLRYDRGAFFWDERAATIEEQVLMPIQDAVEMGMDLDDLSARLREQEYYPPLFARAFGNERIDSERIADALAQFLRSMVSYRSRYDEGMTQAGPPTNEFPNFSAEENRGKAIFMERCNSCHGGPLSASPGARTNGLGDYAGDNGKGEVTGVPRDFNQFKSPSLRNIELTAPYMHDGRFASLTEVIEHYSTGVQLPRALPGLPSGGFRFADDEKESLLAFLLTLTDDSFIADERFSDPFPATATSLSELPARLSFGLDHPFPNPAQASSNFRFRLDAPSDISLSVFDAQGKLIRSLYHGAAAAGEHTIVWNGATDAGRIVGPGIFHIELAAEGRRQNTTLVWLP